MYEWVQNVFKINQEFEQLEVKQTEFLNYKTLFEQQLEKDKLEFKDQYDAVD